MVVTEPNEQGQWIPNIKFIPQKIPNSTLWYTIQISVICIVDMNMNYTQHWPNPERRVPEITPVHG